MNQATNQPTNQPIAILAYVPVLHQGYLQFFQKHPEAKTLYLLDESLTQMWRPLQKDLRALSAKQIKTLIESLELFEKVTLIGKENIEAISQENVEFVMPAEEINEQLAKDYFAQHTITFDTIFLRWDRKNSLSFENIEPDVEISEDEFDQKIMNKLQKESQKSSDWWRQIAAALIKDGKVILTARNQHVPFDQQAYVDGDPRGNFSTGVNMDIATSIHAEGMILAQAAKQGISTEGCSLYVTTFPCPYCAPVVAESGIKKLFYSDGYSMVQGAEMLKAKGVEIIKVVSRVRK